MSVQPGQQHGAREAILGKIRKALQIPAPRPGHHAPITKHGATSAPEGVVSAGGQPSLEHLDPPVQPGSAARAGEAQGVVAASTIQDVTGGRQILESLNVVAREEWRQFLPPAGEAWEQWVELFAANSAGLKTEFHMLESTEALSSAVATLAGESNWRKIARHQHPLLVDALSQLDLPQVITDDGGYDKDELAACDVGFSTCDALIAQTGTVLLACSTGGGRALSVLPPHHVVVARRDQILPDLPAAFALLRESYGGAWPSSITFITGPSRTGDIERILVLGAHGPKRLTIFVV